MVLSETSIDSPACDDGDDEFFVCEFAEQGDFGMYLRKTGGITGNGSLRMRIWNILLDAALAIHYLHSIGIVHGGVSHQNILVGNDGHGKLSGFISSFEVSNSGWTRLKRNQQVAMNAVFLLVLMDIISDSSPTCTGWASALWMLGGGQSVADDAAVRCDVCITKRPLQHRPEVFTDPEWQLILDMCATEPEYRIEMPEVVERLARLIAVDAAIDQLASDPPPPKLLDCRQRNRGQSNLLTAMSESSTSDDFSSDSDCDDDDIYVLTSELKNEALEVKVKELNQVDSLKRSAEHAADDCYGNNLETLLNAEEHMARSRSHGLLMASQPRKRYGRPWCLPPKPPSSKWILSTDNIAEATWQGTDLGSGSFAAVRLGTWIGAPVALKKLKQFDLKSAQALREEANIWFTLRHPHIVSFYGACTKGYPLFVSGGRLDQCRGSNASDNDGKRKVEGKVTDEQIWGYLHDAAIGLQGLHLHGVVHADLKCDNILIIADGRAKLIDFGLSCVRTYDGGAAHGALHWKAPECIQGSGPTFESDIYGLGMCIIQAFSGHCPWGRSPDNAVRVLLRNGGFPKKPVALNQVQWESVRRMCYQDPQARLKLDFVVRVLARCQELHFWRSK